MGRFLSRPACISVKLSPSPRARTLEIQYFRGGVTPTSHLRAEADNSQFHGTPDIHRTDLLSSQFNRLELKQCTIKVKLDNITLSNNAHGSGTLVTTGALISNGGPPPAGGCAGSEGND
jgi:hypothetical protein